MSRRRVVITGLGTVNPLSTDVASTWKGFLAGQNGVSLIEELDCSQFKVKFGGEVKKWDPEKVLDPKVSRKIDPPEEFQRRRRKPWPFPRDEPRTPARESDAATNT